MMAFYKWTGNKILDRPCRWVILCLSISPFIPLYFSLRLRCCCTRICEDKTRRRRSYRRYEMGKEQQQKPKGFFGALPSDGHNLCAISAREKSCLGIFPFILQRATTATAYLVFLTSQQLYTASACDDSAIFSSALHSECLLCFLRFLIWGFLSPVVYWHVTKITFQ